MGDRLSYRTCQPIGPEQEAAISLAADAFNQGRAWVLTVVRDERDGHLICRMKEKDQPAGDPAAGKWPGPYEALGLLKGLCGISRDCKVDWEIHDPYGLRPVGIIRGGECHADSEAQAEAVRNMGEVLLRGGSSSPGRQDYP